MSIEYDMQKSNLAVIIIVNFHKFNFECFWLDDGGISTKALKGGVPIFKKMERAG